jgi:hypothetical protein
MEVHDLQTFVISQELALKKILKSKAMPVVEVGDQCNDPYPCDFLGFCSKDIGRRARLWQKSPLKRRTKNAKAFHDKCETVKHPN